MIVQHRVKKTHNKIKSLDELANGLAALKARGMRVVQCHGVFDLLHIGHIRHFEQAKSLGDVLVVTVTPDKFVNKGPGRPAFSQDLRAEAIASLDCVDFVAVNSWPTSDETIKLLKPDFYVKGREYKDAKQDRTGGISLEEAAITSVGGKLVFTDDITFSSSNLINDNLSSLSQEARDYLTQFKKKYPPTKVLSYLEKAQTLKVLTIGEAIIDEYQYCEAIGKSAKEPMLAMKHLSTEKFAGGILAVGNHVSNFSNNVGLLTFLGSYDTHEDFIKERLNERIDAKFLYRTASPTIVKRRFVENYFFTKLIEVYEINDGALDEKDNKVLCSELEAILPRYDLVDVVDFGHGALSPEAINILCKRAPLLAVNTQSNAANVGYNTISKYTRADYVSLAESEVRLEARDRRGDLRKITLEIADRMGCKQIAVTRGKYGCLCYSKDEGFFEIPAFATQVVDRMGAGDAFLAITSLCVAQGAPIEIVGFIGNVVGSLAVATVGHRSSIERLPLIRYIETLLK